MVIYFGILKASLSSVILTSLVFSYIRVHERSGILSNGNDNIHAQKLRHIAENLRLMLCHYAFSGCSKKVMRNDSVFGLDSLSLEKFEKSDENLNKKGLN